MIVGKHHQVVGQCDDGSTLLDHKIENGFTPVLIPLGGDIWGPLKLKRASRFL